MELYATIDNVGEDNCYAHVSLTTGGKTYRLQRPVGLANPDRWPPDSEWQYLSGTSLTASPTQWVVTVQPSPGLPTNIAPNATVLKGGPWIFDFALPPLRRRARMDGQPVH